MGLFAYVDYTAPCHKCGAAIDEFQTKSIDDLFMQTVKPEDIGHGTFYTICPACQEWNEYRVVPSHGIRIEPNHYRK